MTTEIEFDIDDSDMPEVIGAYIKALIDQREEARKVAKDFVNLFKQMPCNLDELGFENLPDWLD